MIDENAIEIGAKIVDIATEEGFWGTAKELAGSPKLIWTFLTMQHFYGRAREINARSEAKEEYEIIDREHHALKHHLKEYLNTIESKLWHSITEFEQKNYVDENYHMVIKKGNSTVNMAVEKFCDGYHAAYGKEVKHLGSWIYEKVSEEVGQFNTKEERIDFLDKYGEQFRSSFFDRVHKRSGYNASVSEMEGSTADYQFFRDVLESVLTFAEKRRNIREKEEDDMSKKYSINVLSVFKVFRTIFGRRKRKKK